MLLNTGDSLWSDRWKLSGRERSLEYFHPCSLTHDAYKSFLCCVYGLEFIFRMQIQPETGLQLSLVSAFRSGSIPNWPQCPLSLDFRSKSMHVNKPPAFLILKQTFPLFLHLWLHHLCLNSANQLNQLCRCGCLKKRVKNEALSLVTNKREGLAITSHWWSENHQPM